MPQTNEHGRLIAAAAKAALAPLGCKRVGQSRFWYSDQRFWTVSIEFQPSGWAKGSYLNVGANWLWYPKSAWGFSFTEDPRIEDVGFIRFETVEQFTPLIAAVVNRAAQEVLSLREKYRSIAGIYNHLLGRVVRDGLPVYHAAVAAGLAGDMTTSRALLQRLKNWETCGRGWQDEIKSNGNRLGKFADDPVQFRSAVAGIIADVRDRLHLPFDPELLRTLDSTAAA